MTGAYVDKGYVFAVARLRYAELKLLNNQAMDQLVSASDYEDAVKVLKEKGWGGDNNTEDAEALLQEEREKLWSFVDEIVPDRSIFDVFKLPNDYNNLKAALKESVMEYDYPGIYISESTVDPELIRNAIKERNYQALPDDIIEAAEYAHSTFLKTADGQLCDIIVDKACLDAILKAGKATENDFLEMYAEIKVASTDIKTAVRAALTGKDKDFLNMALAECATVDKNGLANAALNGVDAIASYLGNTAYADAVSELRKSPAAFERWCDNLITARMKPQLYESFGLGPIAAYILARENEIKSVRIILSGKQNGFSKEMIAERVRDCYV